MTVIERMERHEAKGRLIRRLREERGYSQQFVANGIGVARSTIQKVESGEAGTNDDRFWDFCELMGVSEAEFAHMLENELARENTVSEEEKRIEDELIVILKYQSLHIKRILHHIFCGGFKGNVERLFDLVAIHVSLPLVMRLQSSRSYVANYTLYKGMGLLPNQCPEEPDVDALNEVNEKDALTAAMGGKEGY